MFDKFVTMGRHFFFLIRFEFLCDESFNEKVSSDFVKERGIIRLLLYY